MLRWSRGEEDDDSEVMTTHLGSDDDGTKKGTREMRTILKR